MFLLRVFSPLKISVLWCLKFQQQFLNDQKNLENDILLNLLFEQIF